MLYNIKTKLLLRNKTNSVIRSNKAIKNTKDDKPIKPSTPITTIKPNLIMEKKNKAFFITHFGLGDHLTTLPIVKYLGTQYDKVIIACKKSNLENLKMIYNNDNKVIIHPFGDMREISPLYNKSNFHKYSQDCDLFITGYHRGSRSCAFKNIPFNFYDDLKLDYSIFWTYFSVPDIEPSNKLYNLVKNKKYYFVHNSTSNKEELFSVNKIHNFNIVTSDVVLINPCKNMYEKSHKYYTIASKFVNLPLLHYKKTIIYATKLYLSDSSFFCLAMNLVLKASKCYLFPRSTYDYHYLWTPKFKYDEKSGKKKFIIIR